MTLCSPLFFDADFSVVYEEYTKLETNASVIYIYIYALIFQCYELITWIGMLQFNATHPKN